MFLNIPFFHEQRTEREMTKHYKELEVDRRIHMRAMIPSAIVLLVFGGVVLWMYWMKSPTELIDVAVPFFAKTLVLASAIGFNSRRSLKCHNKFHRYANSEKTGRRFVACETCKTFFREIDSD